MRAHSTFVIALFSLQGISQLSGAPDVPAAQLRWNSGELISGQIGDSTDSFLTWKSPLFDEPLTLKWEALNRIDQHLESEKSPESFSFTCRDGSHFFGDIVSITEDSIGIKSVRHGHTQILRTELLSIRRLQSRATVKATADPRASLPGPHGDADWSPVQVAEASPRKNQNLPANRPQTEAIVAGPGGSLQIPYWNQSIVRKMELPARIELEFQIRTAERPDFELTVTGRDKHHFSIETWDTELVLHTAGTFKHLLTLPAAERVITLRIFWDQETHNCVVYAPSGQKLAELNISRDQVNTPQGFLLKNKGRSLALDFLRPREWTGNPPPPIHFEKPYLELADGRLINATVSALQDRTILLNTSEPSPVAALSIDDVDAIIFSRDPAAPPSTSMTLSYSDGTFLCGKINSIAAGNARLQTAFSKAFFPAALTGLRQLRTGAPRQTTGAPPDADKLEILGTTFHGTLVCDGNPTPGWLPEGGVTPSSPAKGFANRITRYFPNDTDIPTPESLVYTVSGDVLPGAIASINASGIELNTSLLENKKIAAQVLTGIQMSPRPQVRIHGFTDGWTLLKGDESTVQRSESELKMEPDTALYHPEAMSCSALQFEVPPSNFAVTALHFFSDGTPSPCPTLLILRTDEQLLLKTENVTGGVGAQTSAKVPSDQSVAVQLILNDKAIEVWINGISQQTIKLDGKNLSPGLVLEPGALWGNRIQATALTHFSGKSQPGKLSLPTIHPEAKLQALTVPRFRKDTPPKHILLAPNGDVLRGELESASSSEIKFRSGVESLTIPRNRVQAAIWLKKQGTSSPNTEAARGTLKRLERNITDGGWGGDLQSHLQHIKDADPSLRFKSPNSSSAPHASLIFEGTSLAKALEAICAAFDLQYRIDTEGSILLEPLSQSLADPLVQKTYWLNTEPFPPETDPTAFFITQGISFPRGTQLTWEPISRQLFLTNTTENHTKICDLLTRSYGGILGSPTHWLVLTNGARLGLNVRAFTRDTILGQHPIYGSCRIPLSQIYQLANFVQPLPGAWKSLESWELIAAPEPIIPESNGENSPLLSKPASPFVLPLLTGGEFDLTAEKGKIVILDFWATWCGPCVKSLPELTEALSVFPKEAVHLVAINQGEAASDIIHFLTQRGCNPDVALDRSQAIGKLFGVEGIPHTVIIGPDGIMEWVKTGYSPANAKEAAAVVQRLLDKSKP